jgi:dihydroxy-acid dehydratase
MIEAHQFRRYGVYPQLRQNRPGMLMAAMRVNIPAFLSPAVRWLPGAPLKAKIVDLISVFEGVGAYQAGKIDAQRLKMLEDYACPAAARARACSPPTA